ncbi:MAG: folate-binding protein YgfZ [Xanthomonadales bacterium]|nr:hypothetical protein [Gammaproteobacteria bacterium]MBT8052779.1 hypothetical protein [Gammaproteobacteria bacterium]NND56158.1 folate-binding protein YgfZ [Xanthomonadales bacterium]NNK50563.1 folate-binding protein YgfZ [Xanthomonadales bacterium]
MKSTINSLNYLSTARFQGAEAGDFLQNQLSADIAALKPGEASFACYCSPKGKVLGLLLVCRRTDDFLVAAAADLLPRILERLSIFVMRTRVEFSAQSGLHVLGAGISSEPVAEESFQPGGLPLQYVFSDRDAAGHGTAFKNEELRLGVTWLNAETTEKFIPQMLGYDRIGAVSFSKGCYPGQEIVARARYLGKVKRAPVIVQVDEETSAAPSDSVEICRDEAWSRGTIIDSVAGENGGTLLVIVAPLEPESPVTGLKHNERLYRCATT